MLKLPEENIDYIYEYTKQRIKVFVLALGIICIIGLIVWCVK